MKTKNLLFIIPLFILSLTSCASDSGHPRIYTSSEEYKALAQKIETEEWANTSFENLKNEIDTYVTQHETDPEWIVSRLAMYWKEGERYTQCYIKHQDWDYGEGNAPIPTVRLPGMRRWNNYKNVPLADRTPYNATGDMLGVDRSSDDNTYHTVPYKESGHMIRQNNAEILALAEKSAFAYWVTKEEKYAKFSADILWTWLLGTYYMEPPLDPEKSSKGPGGYAPGGILGYYDYEVIHDDRQDPAACTYDFIYDYLCDNPHEHLATLGLSTTEVAGVVFKRFIEIGLVRGGKRGNWNVNRYRHLMNSMLVLESNDYYADGKGREYYIPFYTEIETDIHDPLPNIMKIYDPITGLWPESPGYASSMIPTVMEMGIKLYKNGINTIESNPITEKAAMANLGWLDARGNLVVFGDMRGGPFTMSVFETLLTYYTKEGNAEKAKSVASVIRNAVNSGTHDRGASGFMGICLNEPLPESGDELPYNRAAYSPFHRHIIMKNGNDTDNGMMFTLYGGSNGSHLSKNGLAMQFYGKGYALGAKSSSYESYWTNDFKYHSTATGANTIMPGYTHGEISINAMDPMVDATQGLYNTNTTSTSCSFADISADEKRRMVAMVRTSPTTGYYVDIFRSKQKDNDYVQHCVGDQFELKSEAGKKLNLKSTTSLGTEYNSAYSFYENQDKVAYGKNFLATWTTTKASLKVDMWMMGQQNRELYQVEAPAITLRDDVTPAAVNRSPQKTSALIVRQSNNDAAENPFVAIFESYDTGKKNIESINKIVADKSFVCLQVKSKGKQEQIICNATDNKIHTPTSELSFTGTLAIASMKDDAFEYLYLGSGQEIKMGKYQLKSLDGALSAELRLVDGKFYYSSDKKVAISTGSELKTYEAGYNILIN